jgi:chromosomal replication initiation ATPase DnaA
MASPIRSASLTDAAPIEPSVQPEDLDVSLRPRRIDEFVGQRKVKEQLAIFIEAARKRGQPLDHVLFAGPPGLGKTSLAQIVAEELDVPFVMTAGPALEKKGDVAAFLTALEPNSSSSMRSTGFRAHSRRRSIPRWRTANFRSPSAKALARESSRWISRHSP